MDLELFGSRSISFPLPSIFAEYAKERPLGERSFNENIYSTQEGIFPHHAPKQTNIIAR